MSDFPDIQLPHARKRSVSKPQLRSEFENGTTQVRSKGTRPKRTWTLSWELLPIEDWNTLKQHFIDNSGGSFTVSKDMIYEDVDYTVIYSIDEIEASSTGVKGEYSVEIKLEEL